MHTIYEVGKYISGYFRAQRTMRLGKAEISVLLFTTSTLCMTT